MPPHEAQEPIAITAAARSATSCRTSRELHVDALVARRDRSLYDRHERIGALDRRAKRALGVGAGGGHQRLVVVERDQVEDERREIRLRRPEQAFRAARAVLEMEPDDGEAPRLLHLARHVLGAGDVRQREPERRRDHQLAAEEEELTPPDAGSREMPPDRAFAEPSCSH
jgi:hypothetical protein